MAVVASLGQVADRRNNVVLVLAWADLWPSFFPLRKAANYYIRLVRGGLTDQEAAKSCITAYPVVTPEVGLKRR